MTEAWKPPAELRARAERELAGRPRAHSRIPELEEVIAELEVHEVELELQNEELRAAQLQIDSAIARYRELFEAAPVAYLILDSRGRIRDANLRATELLGTSRAELVGTHLTRYMSERDSDRVRLLRQASDSSELTLELRMRKSTGEWFRAQLALSDSGDQGTRAAIVRLGREQQLPVDDLRERVEHDRELQEGFLRFRRIAEHIDDAFYVAETSSGKTLYTSPAFERIFGTQPAAFAWLTAVHPDDRNDVEECFARLLAGEACDEEHRVVRRDGSLHIVRHRAFVVEGADRVIGIVTDVTQARTLELELRQAQKLETLGALASGIAHDFNNLLMGITGCAQMALAQLEPSNPARRHVQQGLDAALRGASITRQLLAFGRKQPVERRAIEVDSVILAARELLMTVVGSSVAITIDAHATGARVFADTGDIEQILMNLATNARDAMPDGGKLSIRTELRVRGETDRCTVVLDVEDTGAGMDEHTRAHLFEPFFTTKSDGRGTGLGMASVAALIARMGGTISVRSRPGQGTSFRMSLPVATIEIEPESAPEPTPSSGGTVLVVEDDGLVRATLGHYLRSIGYRALLAASYEEALRVASGSERLDALVTDALLPGRLGQDVARELKSRYGELPVLFVSAHPARDLVRRGQVPKDALLLQKPFDQTLLAAALRDAFEQRTKLEPPRTVLLVDDSEAALSVLRDYLRSKGYRVLAAGDERQALALAHDNQIDVLVTDFALRDTTGTELAARLRESKPALPVLLVSGSAEVQVPPGARFLQKPFELERLDAELADVLRPA